MIEPPNVPPAANPLSVVQFALANLHGGVHLSVQSGLVCRDRCLK